MNVVRPADFPGSGRFGGSQRSLTGYRAPERNKAAIPERSKAARVLATSGFASLLRGIGLSALVGAVVALTCGGALAEVGWSKLSGSKLSAALASRTLGFPEGVTVGFFSDGRALKGWEWGRWWLENEQVCVQWPDRASRCYAVARRGIDLRFRHPEVTLIGRYIDLQ